MSTAAQRAANMRRRNRDERLPDRELLDRAIASGLANWVDQAFAGDVHAMNVSPLLKKIVRETMAALDALDIDTSHPTTKERLKARLRIQRRPARPNRF